MSHLRRYRLARTITMVSAISYVALTWDQPYINGLNLMLGGITLMSLLIAWASLESHELTAGRGA